MVNVEYDTCIIGAGWSGLLACKYFKAEGLNPIVLERNAYIGGVWRHDPDRATGGVLASTYTTSSAIATEMSDYPMPDDFPAFPRHTQIMDYLQAYHDHFELGPHIRLGDGVRSVEKSGDGWRIEAEHGEVFECARVVVCSGVHQEAADSGRGHFTDFEGTVIHSTQLEAHLPKLRNKRVLIVGSGETASDASTEISRLTPHLAMSSPNGQWIVPRVGISPTTEPLLLDHLTSPLRQAIDPFDAPFWAAFEIEYANGRCGSNVPEWETKAPYLSQFLNKNPAPVHLWRDG